MPKMLNRGCKLKQYHFPLFLGIRRSSCERNIFVLLSLLKQSTLQRIAEVSLGKPNEVFAHAHHPHRSLIWLWWTLLENTKGHAKRSASLPTFSSSTQQPMHLRKPSASNFVEIQGYGVKSVNVQTLFLPFPVPEVREKRIF